MKAEISKIRKLSKDLHVLLKKALLKLSCLSSLLIPSLSAAAGIRNIITGGVFHSVCLAGFMGMAGKKKGLMVFHSRRTLAVSCYLEIILDVHRVFVCVCVLGDGSRLTLAGETVRSLLGE